ncbi:MAG: hypothetical protein RIS88_871 [Pseudomonadota bacterium]|jgi:hypothetical protein
MPQHPKYSNSPSRDLQGLYQLLDDMERFGFVQEEIHQYLDVVMSELYPQATRELIQQESGSEREAVEEDFTFVPGASALFHYVDAGEQPQFIQDLRNLIAHCMSSDTWSTDGVADTIRSERNIEYYRYHVMLVEDTGTLERYRHSRRTVWFPSEITPVRPGPYEISPTEYDPKHGGFAYWDGKRWYASRVLLADCLAQPRADDEVARWDYCWRGFLNAQD